MAPALHPDAHVRHLRLVSNRARCGFARAAADGEALGCVMYMKRRNILFVLAALSISSGFLSQTALAHKEGQILDLSKLPAAAQATIKDHVGDGQMGRIDKLDEGGKTAYE